MRTRDVARQRAIERKEPMELARQLRAKREERGLSQDEVSKAIFVSRQTISNWENDKTYPDVQSLLLLSQLFEVSIDALVRGDVVAMQRAIAEDSRKMRLLSIGMLVFSGLAFLFLLGFSIAWPEPSGFARMSKGNLAGAATFIVLYAIGFAMAIGVDRLKKKHDVVTYREIDRFLKGEVAPSRYGRPRPQAPGARRSSEAFRRRLNRPAARGVVARAGGIVASVWDDLAVRSYIAQAWGGRKRLHCPSAGASSTSLRGMCL